MSSKKLIWYSDTSVTCCMTAIFISSPNECVDSTSCIASDWTAWSLNLNSFSFFSVDCFSSLDNLLSKK
jgi:hypothetical protein